MASNAAIADRMPTLHVSVGIMAYNEAANIAKAIESIADVAASSHSVSDQSYRYGMAPAARTALNGR